MAAAMPRSDLLEALFYLDGCARCGRPSTNGLFTAQSVQERKLVFRG